ncbi:hypothetical protein [Thermaerobacter subterraneus]|uniref:DUF5667 domain-containing protein n=1 Tax=Thermaerobacter subterraneus DSM 13965 TaxID=867903 RepID=K6Q3T5_9FIRM|nr:hypothetical protein [Thermaerobacter subterraneus]EKP95764.1 hypothetical protein ThesuDRAFT_01524 [Thermaerobacter subterraneus DSM 13965]
MVERDPWPRRATRRVAVALLWVLLTMTALPGLAMASSGDGAVAGQPGASQATAGVPADAPGSSGEPGWFFAVAYYARYASEQVRLWVSRDPAGDAALAASFAAQRAGRLAELAPASAWFERLAADIAGYLRLAQEGLVQARAEGAATDRAVTALEDAVARVEALPQRVAAGRDRDQGAVEAAPAAGDQGDGGTGAEESLAAEPVEGEAVPEQAASDGSPAGDTAEAGGTGAAAEGTGGQDPLDQALEAAAEAELVAGSVAMMEPAEIIALRDQGYGYGQIALLYATAQAIRQATGEEVTAADVAARLASLAGGEGDTAEPQPVPGEDGTPSPTEDGDAGTPEGEPGSPAGAGSAGTGEEATGGAGTALAQGVAAKPVVKVKAFGRTLNELLALYGIHRRDLKPGRWISAAHRPAVQPPAQGEPEDTAPGEPEPDNSGDEQQPGDADEEQPGPGETEVTAPGSSQPEEPAAGEDEEEFREDGDEEQAATTAAATLQEQEREKAPVQREREDRPGRGQGSARHGERAGSARGAGAGR